MLDVGADFSARERESLERVANHDFGVVVVDDSVAVLIETVGQRLMGTVRTLLN